MKIKKGLSILVAGLFVFSITSCNNNAITCKVKAKNTVEPSLNYNNIEHDIYNSGLSGAITNNVDAIRFLMTKEVAVDENYLDLYFGLNQNLDLSDSTTTLDLEMRALKSYANNEKYDTRIKVYIVDTEGAIAAARLGNAIVTYTNGSTTTIDCNNAGNPDKGFSCFVSSQDKFLSQSIRTYSFTKDNFQLYNQYSPTATQFNYSSVSKVIVETLAPKDNGTYYQYEVMNINSSKSSNNVNLFSASNAIKGDSRDVLKNQWYFDSIPSVSSYSEDKKNSLGILVEQVKGNDGGVTLINSSNKDANYWLRSYGQTNTGESDINNLNTTVDCSMYDHIAFYADTTQCATDINVEIKLYWTDPNAVVSSDSNRYFRAGSASFYYVPEVGEPYYGRIPSGSYIEKGFKGYVYLDLYTFLQDGVGGSYLTIDRLKSVAKNIRFIFNSKPDYQLTNGLEGIGKVNIKDIKFVDAVRSNLEIEKIFTKLDLEFDEETTSSEIVQTLPSTITIGADIINSKKMAIYEKEEIIENQFIQLEGSWNAGSIDNNGLIELTFTPSSDSAIKLYNQYSFYNDVSFVFYGYVKRKIDVNISSPSDNNSSTDFSESDNDETSGFISNSESLNSSDVTSENNDPVVIEPSDTKKDYNIALKIGIGVCATLIVFEIIAIIVRIRRKK